MTYDFSLDRKAVIVLSAGSVVLVLLVFLAGFLTGMSWPQQSQMASSGRAPIAKSPATPLAKPESVKPDAARQPEKNEPASAPEAAQPAPQPTKSPPAETTPAPAPASAPASSLTVASAAPSAEQSGVRLAVVVGSFLDKANAEKLVEHLKDAGYSAQIVAGSNANKHWNVVRVGPYQDWDEANQIATLLSRDQGSPAFIRAMR